MEIHGANTAPNHSAIDMMEDSRVGLSIDSGSASCASDLSDSQASWYDDDPGDEDASILLCPTNVRDLPRTPSFRSRIPRRDDDEEEDIPRRRRETASSWDDDTRIARHPRAPSLRFCLTLCTLTLVLLSLTSGGNGNGNENSPMQELDIRRNDVVLHPDSMKLKPRRMQGQNSEVIARNHLPPGDPKAADGIIATNRSGTRARANLAMARTAEHRPVFGAVSPVERIVLENAPQTTSGGDTYGLRSNWTSWLAAMALVAMLLETGYKEYRLCRMDDFFEEQRRL